MTKLKLLLMGILASGLLATGAFAQGTASVELTSVSGPVEIGSGEPPVWRRAQQGDALTPGDAVRTGPGARVEVALASGVARLYENSLMRIPTGAFTRAGVQNVELQQGSSLFDVVKGKLRDPFEVKTPEVVVSVKGTRFEVNLDKQLAAVSVFRGTVGVMPPTGPSSEVLVRSGFAAVGGANVPFELSVIDAEDPWQSWGSSFAPQANAAKRAEAIAKTTEVNPQAAATKVMRSEVAAQIEARSAADPAHGASSVATRKRAMAKMLKERAAVPASMDPSSEAGDQANITTDPVVDQPDELMKEKMMMDQVAEIAIRDAADGGTFLSKAGMDVSFIAHNKVNVEADGFLTLLSESDLEKVAQDKRFDRLGDALLQSLANRSLDPASFASGLLGQMK